MTTERDIEYQTIYFHIGACDHLLTSIKQFRHYNPDSSIHLIGRGVQEEIKNLVHFYDYETLFCDQTLNFLKNFRNYSTNNADFEKICILRWFLMRNLARQKGFTRLFCLDSDMMVYCDIEKELQKFESCRYALSSATSAAVLCVNDISVLDDYCRYVEGFYDESNHTASYILRGNARKTFKHIYDDILGSFMNRQTHNLMGGICDMTFWGELRKMDDPTMIGEISGIHDDTTFDHNINASDFFDFKNGMKNIIWKEGLPYCKNMFLNRLIRFNSLHFQGFNTKRLMNEYKSYE